MKKLIAILLILTLITFVSVADASIEISDGFENAWTGDLADNWAIIGYAHGEPSTPKMEQVSQVGAITPNSGSNFLALSVTEAGYPVNSTNWWGGVRRTDVSTAARNKEYTPSVSVYFYDTGSALPIPQLSLVPITADPAWTDISFGQRWNQEANYWYHEADGAGWTETNVARTTGWQKLEITLASDGKLSFYINDDMVGVSQSSYENLGTLWLQSQFDDGNFTESTVYFDDFTFTSTIPEPATLALLGLGALGLLRKRK